MQIPQRPADLERLWALGEPLDVDDLPAWLPREHAWYYRRIAAPAEIPNDAGELAKMDQARLIWDATGIYLPDPTTPIWSIGVYRGASLTDLAPLVAGPTVTRDDVDDVIATYVADPFLARDGDTWHMFFEVYNWRDNKGEIGLASSKGGDRWRYQHVVLAEPFHLSYPYVFEHDSQWWMVPETGQVQEVRLYCARTFPHDWTYVRPLIAGDELVDSSLFRYDGHWWLFAGAQTGSVHDTLRLYQAPTLEGPWREHPRSPIVAGDSTGARPAGRVLASDDRLIRFGQDCSRAYGEAVRAFEIIELTETAYAERPLGSGALLGPGDGGWNAGGMHHIDVQHAPDGALLAAVDGWTATP